MRKQIALFATVLALAGCAEVTPVPTSPESTTQPAPLPDGTSTVTDVVAPEPHPVDCGNPVASLRPRLTVPPGTPPPITPNVDAIRARGRLIVGLDTGSNLFSFRDPLTGDVEGFDVDIAREVARDLFGDPNRVEFRILSSLARTSALVNADVDVVVKTMTINCQRRQQVTFSTVYYQADQRILAVKGSGISSAGDLGGKKVCVASGTTSQSRIQVLQPPAQIISVPSWADCLVVLQQREVDAVSTDDSILGGLAAQDPYLEIVGGSLGAEPYGIGITKGHDDLVRFVNGTLERIRSDGTWNDIYDRWLSVLGRSPGPPYPTYSE
ncbi:ABC transporter substrate-binding protein [Rhodococcoides trifolii]|uniref:ABC transporter substrate-binding protein n=1 Tax=Rhodococcoides trifolii TaxID=908250 RepID=A0A917CPL7_9NOCA|nr:glutamate ABC transporter substrate-binding protein [Rhodococcus trifolii]GGF94496.1 ABC transporter substrate-binding protein [Rhodococcus trifolii]